MTMTSSEYFFHHFSFINQGSPPIPTVKESSLFWPLSPLLCNFFLCLLLFLTVRHFGKKNNTIQMKSSLCYYSDLLSKFPKNNIITCSNWCTLFSVWSLGSRDAAFLHNYDNIDWCAVPLNLCNLLWSWVAYALSQFCSAGWILRLTPCWLTASLQVVQTLLQTGSPSANSKSPLILHTHKACVCQDETGDCNRRTLKKIRGCSKIISVYKMHVNVPIFSLCDSGLTAEMEAAGLLSFWKNMKQLQVCDCPLLSCCGPK